MPRTEQSATRISPQNGLGLMATAKDLKLEDLAMAYGPHMPAAHTLFSRSGRLDRATTERARI